MRFPSSPDRLTAANFDSLTKPLRPALLKIARRDLQAADADDVVQTALCAGWRSLDRYDPSTGQSGLFAWLRLLLRRAKADFFRELSLCAETPGLPDGYLETPDPGRLETAFEEAAAEDLRARLERVELSGPQDYVVRARLRGETLEAIGEDLGISAAAVSYHLRRAVERLQQPGEIELSAFAEYLFSMCSKQTVYHKPTGVFDHTGTAEEVQRRRYRDMKSPKPSKSQRRRAAMERRQ